MGKAYFNSIRGNKNITNIFVDFFDTIVHRSVHPNHVLRLWAKIMIRELGIDMRIDELYFIRKASSQFLSTKNKKHYIEVDYDKLISEIYNRLTSISKLAGISIDDFSIYFELAEVRSEINVQHLNVKMVNLLKSLKKNEYKIYCVSDFYTSASVLKKLLKHHDIDGLFDNIFASSDHAKSKSNGNLYPYLLEKLDLDAKNVLMIGDSLTSDVKNAEKHGLAAIHIPNREEHKTKKKYLIGSDKKDFRRCVKWLYRTCNASKAPANSDYILYYSVYIERLYHHAKKEGIRNIFFLSREGLFLKRLFEHYQKHFSLRAEDAITAHYFKASRQSTLLVSLANVDDEKYVFLRRKYPHLNLKCFLLNFTFSEELIAKILEELGFSAIQNEVISNFLDSEIFQKLKSNETFREAYEINKEGQKKAFETYLDSFGVDFYKEDMHLADIGWGGSMQECLYDYFKGEVNVYGHYLGLNEIYKIRESTKRQGLNFSIFPYARYTDNILRGNTELNEQLLSADHGSTLSYNHLPTLTNEHHNETEKKIFKEHILEIQEFMFSSYKEMLKKLDKICYDDDIVQNEMTDYAMRGGLFASKRKVASAMKIAEGFYTNVGDFSRGLKISPRKYSKDAFKLMRTFVLGPDKLFPLILRIKPYLYSKKKYYLAYLVPMWLIYYYIRLNRFLKKSVLSKMSRFKYAYLR